MFNAHNHTQNVGEFQTRNKGPFFYRTQTRAKHVGDRAGGALSLQYVKMSDGDEA